MTAVFNRFGPHDRVRLRAVRRRDPRQRSARLHRGTRTGRPGAPRCSAVAAAGRPDASGDPRPAWLNALPPFMPLRYLAHALRDASVGRYPTDAVPYGAPVVAGSRTLPPAVGRGCSGGRGRNRPAYAGRMVNLTRIYTRTGDQGTTNLGDMSRTAKTDLRIAAYADANEANAVIGTALALGQLDDEVVKVLVRVQNDLFDVGADAAGRGAGVPATAGGAVLHRPA